MSYLPEIPEADATGTVAETYADVRRVVGLAPVNLVYRHLAATPGRLESVWAELRPNLLAVEPELEPEAPPGAVRLADAPGLDLALARSTLDAYRRANSRNLVAMASLLEGAPGTGAPAAAREPAAPAAVLPLADLRTLPPASRALLDELSSALVGGAEPRLVPSLLRHFAHDPDLLARLWTAIGAAAAAVPERAAAVCERARARARELPYPVSPATPPVRAVAERFAPAMAAMLVTGELLRGALP